MQISKTINSKGYHSVTPYLIIRRASEAIEFYRSIFGAVEKFRIPAPDNRIAHAEIIIGDSHIMLADEFPENLIQGPETLGGSPVSLLLYVPNVDEIFQKAIEAGAKENRPVRDQFYGAFPISKRSLMILAAGMSGMVPSTSNSSPVWGSM